MKKQENLLLDINGLDAGNSSGMTLQDTIYRKLSEAFSPSELAVEDESVRHAGHAGAQPGGETHFRVRIVSSIFVGMSRVERHRRIYDALGGELKMQIHALALTALATDEVKLR